MTPPVPEQTDDEPEEDDSGNDGSSNGEDPKSERPATGDGDGDEKAGRPARSPSVSDLFVTNVTFNNGKLRDEFFKTLSTRTSKDLKRDVTKDVSEEGIVESATDADSSDYARQAREAEIATDKIKNEILEAERDRLRQQKTQRRIFFFWAIAAISGILVFNGFVFSWYMDASRGTPSDAVLISWITTSIVEVIGLGYIIARSLFRSQNNEDANGSTADKRSRGSS